MTDKSPRRGYILAFDIELPKEYPNKPPKLHAVSKVWNPIFDEKGDHIKLPIVEPENWKPATKIEQCLVSIRYYLTEGEVDTSDLTRTPLNEAASDMFVDRRPEYDRTAKEYTETSNEGYGDIAFEDLQVACLEKLLSIPMAVRYNCTIYGKKIDDTTVQLFLVLFPDTKIHKENAEKYINDFQVDKALTTYKFDFEFPDKVIKIVPPSKSKDKCWDITALESVPPFTIHKNNCDRELRRLTETSPPTCKLEVKWIRSDKEPQVFLEKFNFIQNSNKRQWDVQFNPGITVYIYLLYVQKRFQV